jgi:hypothetical protein
MMPLSESIVSGALVLLSIIPSKRTKMDTLRSKHEALMRLNASPSRKLAITLMSYSEIHKL